MANPKNKDEIRQVKKQLDKIIGDEEVQVLEDVVEVLTSTKAESRDIKEALGRLVSVTQELKELQPAIEKLQGLVGEIKLEIPPELHVLVDNLEQTPQKDEIRVKNIDEIKIPEEVTVKNIKDAKVDEVRVKNLEDIKIPEPKDEVRVKNLEDIKIPDQTKLIRPEWWKDPVTQQQFTKALTDFAVTIKKIGIKQDLDEYRSPNRPIAVRLSNGRRFVDMISQVISQGGTTAFPFEDENGVATAMQVTKEGVGLVGFGDTPNIDAFGRLRIGTPYTIFDNKQIYDSQPLLWDDAEVSGGGTASAHQSGLAATKISVSANTAGHRVRQTFRRFAYQPGKSQFASMTFYALNTTTGITKRAGAFDGNNGVFFQSKDGVVSVGIRSSTSGSPVDNTVNQIQWNLDPMNGNGQSGITLDFSKTQIGVVDYQWLGVGRVRFGFVIGGKIIYCHQFNHANISSVVYTSTPNFPFRYEIINDGNGAASDFYHICTSMMSEGGVDEEGLVRHDHTPQIGALTAGSHYALMGLRLKSTHLTEGVALEHLDATVTSQGDQGHWMLMLNPTVAGTFNYVDVANSPVQVAKGAVANTITGGTYLDGGYFSDTNPAQALSKTLIQLGSTIAGTPNELVFTTIALSANMNVYASMAWREM